MDFRGAPRLSFQIGARGSHLKIEATEEITDEITCSPGEFQARSGHVITVHLHESFSISENARATSAISVSCSLLFFFSFFL